MKRISKRVREEAALICAIAASNECGLIWAAAEAAGATVRNVNPWHLAVDACCFTVDKIGGIAGPATRAEAEALLRTGWVPEGWTS